MQQCNLKLLLFECRHRLSADRTRTAPRNFARIVAGAETERFRPFERRSNRRLHCRRATSFDRPPTMKKNRPRVHVQPAVTPQKVKKPIGLALQGGGSGGAAP